MICVEEKNPLDYRESIEDQKIFKLNLIRIKGVPLRVGLSAASPRSDQGYMH
jgi:hypothetical protein